MSNQSTATAELAHKGDIQQCRDASREEISKVAKRLAISELRVSQLDSDVTQALAKLEQTKRKVWGEQQEHLAKIDAKLDEQVRRMAVLSDVCTGTAARVGELMQAMTLIGKELHEVSRDLRAIRREHANGSDT